MITLAPALAWGFSDRGLLREGMTADLNVFDPATIGPAVPVLVDDLPAGGRRLEQRSTGSLPPLWEVRSPSTKAGRPMPSPGASSEVVEADQPADQRIQRVLASRRSITQCPS